MEDARTPTTTNAIGRRWIEPYAILPPQFHSQPPPSAEKRLMMAILQDAVDVIRAGISQRDQAKPQLFRDAMAWLHERERRWPFSFENICETLGIDASNIRAGVDRMVLDAALGTSNASPEHRRQRGAAPTASRLADLRLSPRGGSTEPKFAPAASPPRSRPAPARKRSPAHKRRT